MEQALVLLKPVPGLLCFVFGQPCSFWLLFTSSRVIIIPLFAFLLSLSELTIVPL